MGIGLGRSWGSKRASSSVPGLRGWGLRVLGSPKTEEIDMDAQHHTGRSHFSMEISYSYAPTKSKSQGTEH